MSNKLIYQLGNDTIGGNDSIPFSQAGTLTTLQAKISQLVTYLQTLFAPLAGALKVGNPVINAGVNGMLFADPSGNLATSVGVLYTNSNAQLTLPFGLSTVPNFVSSFNGYTVSIVAQGSYCAQMSDGTHSVTLCSAAGTVNVTAGSIITLGTSGNTYVWGSDVTPPTPQTLLALPLSVYSSDVTVTNLLGDPDAWALVTVNGINYKIPLYL